MPYIERYWAEADPKFCDGKDAESFSTLLHRAEATLDRLEALPAEIAGLRLQPWAVHPGRAIAGCRIQTERPEKDAQVLGKGSPAIANAERIELEWKDGVWRNTMPQDQDSGLLVQSSVN